MDPQARKEIEAGVQALDEALTGLLSFTMTLRPTLRNEIFQICGKHLDRAREAKERLEGLLQDRSDPEARVDPQSAKTPQAVRHEGDPG